MVDVPDRLDIEIDADTRPIEDALRDLTSLSHQFGAQLTSALRSAVVGGKDLDDILRRIALNLAGMALSRGLQPLQSLAGSLFSNLIGALVPAAAGGIAPFAADGGIAAPSYFPTAAGPGLAEGAAGLPGAIPGNGPAGAASGGGAVSVVFNVTTPDAASFRKSEAQVTGMLARAVSRGGRTF